MNADLCHRDSQGFTRVAPVPSCARDIACMDAGTQDSPKAPTVGV